MPEPRRLATSDGLGLQAEFASVPDAHMGVVLCHPHPQYGGSMRSIVTSALFAALPGFGYACLRFNFRGVEDSEGSWGGGIDEPLDVVAAIDGLAREVGTLPLAVVGWSFGGDMALSVTDTRLAGWVAIAAPLRFRAEYEVATDARPKHLILAANDEVRAAADVEADVADWVATSTEVVAGASHFFVGRTDQVVEATDAFLLKL